MSQAMLDKLAQQTRYNIFIYEKEKLNLKSNEY